MIERFLRNTTCIALVVVASLFLWVTSPGLAAVIKAEEIKTLLTNHAESNMPWSPGDLRLGFPAKIADVTVPEERITTKVQNRPDEDFIGDSSFTVKFFSEGTLIKEQTVRVRMEVLTDVVASAKFLAKGRDIAPGDIHVIKKWLKNRSADFIINPEEIIGKTLTASVRVDTEIKRNMVKTPLCVKKGKIVRIVLDNENVKITTVGISEEDGADGAMIRVKNLSSNRTIYAKVAGDSLVCVEF